MNSRSVSPKDVSSGALPSSRQKFQFQPPEPPQVQRQVKATASALPDVVCCGPDIVRPADEVGQGSGEEITHEERAERADGREDSAREHRCVPPCEPNRLSAQIETRATYKQGHIPVVDVPDRFRQLQIVAKYTMIICQRGSSTARSTPQ